jgi:hypothetical protein
MDGVWLYALFDAGTGVTEQKNLASGTNAGMGSVQSFAMNWFPS